MLGGAIASARQVLAGDGPRDRKSRDPFAAKEKQHHHLSLSAFLPRLPPAASSPSLAANAPPPTSLGALLPSSSTVGFVSLCCLWYLSSAFSSNTGKSILTRFRYPVTLTFVQFAFVAGYCVLILALRERIGQAASHHHQHYFHPSPNANGTPNGSSPSFAKRRRSSISTLDGWGIRKPSRHMFHGTFMMSLFQIAGHVFSSMAIARVPVSTVHTIKALSPLFTVLSYAALFGVRYSSATYVALLPLTVGVMLACSFDLRANAIGFLCALGSTFIFVAQNIFSKKLLPKENASIHDAASAGAGSGGGDLKGAGSDGAAGGAARKLDKLNLLFYSSGMAFFLMIPIWLYSDASALFFSSSAPESTAAAAASTSSTSSLIFFFFANGSVHFAQNLLAFSILARTSPVTYSIASLIKRIAVICIAIVWSNQHVSPVQALGMTSTFAGLWMYNRAKSDVDKGEKKRVQVEKRHDLELPSTVADARVLDGTQTPPSPLLASNNAQAQLGGYSLASGGVNGGPGGSGTLGRRGDASQGSINGGGVYTSSAVAHPAAAPPPSFSRSSAQQLYQEQQQQAAAAATGAYASPTVYAPMNSFEAHGPGRNGARAGDSPSLGGYRSAVSAQQGIPASMDPPARRTPPPAGAAAGYQDVASAPKCSSSRNRRPSADSASHSRPRPAATSAAAQPESSSPRTGYPHNASPSGPATTGPAGAPPPASAPPPHASDSPSAKANPIYSSSASPGQQSQQPHSVSRPGPAFAKGGAGAADSERIMPVPSSLFAPIAAGGGGGGPRSGPAGYR